MYQFITGITFEITLFIVFTIGYLMMDGKIQMWFGADDFESWRNANGRIIKFICILTIVMVILSIIVKYYQFISDPIPTLPT